MTTTDFDAYIDSLPKILAGASTLFRDADGRILIAETTYRQDGKWVLPGGTIESADGETPARRRAGRPWRRSVWTSSRAPCSPSTGCSGRAARR